MVTTKKIKRNIRHLRIRSKIKGTAKRPRLSVFRSLRHIYAQLINDQKGETLAQSSNKNSKMTPSEVGQDIAQKALKQNIKETVFDKGGFKYHGQVKELAEGARKGGLKF